MHSSEHPFVVSQNFKIPFHIIHYPIPIPGENGFNPVWNETCEFDIFNPDLALLRFAVHDEEVFGDSTFIGQSVYPSPCIKTGYCSVQLKNSYNVELDLSSILVHVTISKTYADEEIDSAARYVVCNACRLITSTCVYV